MKISSKGRYAVRIMAELARHKNEFLSVHELSKMQGITVKYLEKIISCLIKAKLITSTRGTNGGYKLLKEPKEYCVADILNATNDLPKLAPCLYSKIECPRAKNCDSISVWENLSSYIVDYLKKITLDDLLNKKI